VLITTFHFTIPEISAINQWQYITTATAAATPTKKREDIRICTCSTK
jgi:hypothetical protein